MVNTTRSNPQGAADEPELPSSTPSPPSLSRKNTDPTHRERRNSRLGQMVGSIRHALREEQEKLFGNSKPTEAAISDRLGNLREHDREQRARVEEEMLWESTAKDSTSPAVEASKSVDLNANGMGADSVKERRGSWGWPGLGTYEEPLHEPAKARRGSSSKGKTAERAAELEPRVEAAAFEAIDNAAESEAYGWPGLGTMPDPKLK